MAELLAALWVISSVTGSRVLPGIYGTHMAHGAPLWRSALSIPTQWLVLPLCWILNTPTTQRLFIYIFALYMITDFVVTPLSKLLMLHHVFCLLGHGIVVLVLPSTFPIYFAGVVSLEVGSGFYNLFCLRPDVQWRAVSYAISMTVSNIIAVVLGYRWLMLDIHLAPKVLNTVITVIMVYLRQKTCYVNTFANIAARLMGGYAKRK